VGKSNENYTISLDIGTGSVGWAVLVNKDEDVLTQLAVANKKINE